jgi:CMP/dCMP kinase
MTRGDPFVLAIDGPAASGKGALARRLAQRYDLAYLDTGLLYRAVGLAVLEAGGAPSDPVAATKAARSLDPARLMALTQEAAKGGGQIRSAAVGNAASEVAAIPGVRAALLDFQRQFVKSPPKGPDGAGRKGAVLDGRDIGTVISPDADVKIYLTASPEIRAERRHKELQGRGVDSIYARVLEDIRERDARDAARASAPLKPAHDAVMLDTNGLDADQAFDAAVGIIERKLGGRGR